MEHVEVGDRVFDKLDAQWKKVIQNDGDTLFFEGGNVMCLSEVEDGDILLESEEVRPRLEEVEVKLFGENGNAFAIMGATVRAMKRAGYNQYVEAYQNAATSGDYNNLLLVTDAWVTIK